MFSSSYALGLVFIVIVSFLWTICSMVVQHLYQDMQFDSPFLIVYIGTSLFSVFLPIRLIYERFGHLLQTKCCGKDQHQTKEIVVIPWGNYPPPTSISADTTTSDAQELIQSPAANNDNDSIELTDSYLDESTSAEASALGILDDYSFNNEFCIQHYKPERSMESRRNTTNTESQQTGSKYSTYLLSHRDHISMASKVAPMWFLSNYFYAMSLEWTSIASSTVLASMGSIFSFLFATCSKFGDEKVTRGKIIGVLLCFCGGVATTYTDSGGDNRMRYLLQSARKFHISDLDSSTRSLLGDLCGLVSAIGYGAYTCLIRYLCPKDEERMSMQLFFGYIGLMNMIVLLPVAIWVIMSSNNDYDSDYPSDWDPTQTQEAMSHVLTLPIFLFLILKGLLDNVLSDYLWARAVILTSATVASVGVGLTIPMAFVADWIMGNYSGAQLGEVWGAVLVLVGFVFVNIDGVGETTETECINHVNNDAEGVNDVNIRV